MYEKKPHEIFISIGRFSGVLMKLRSGDTQKDKINCKESTTFPSPTVLVATGHYYTLQRAAIIVSF